MSTTQDGSESVDQFLARIAGTPQGSSEETRRMDEEFLKGRQERQARRLERARSISPSKTGPAKTTSIDLTTSSLSRSKQALDPPVDFSASTPALSRSNATAGRVSPTKGYESNPLEATPSLSPSTESPKPITSASGLARSGTLSWQQRPKSRDSPRARPLSGSVTARLTSPEPVTSDSQQEQSRAEIAASLAQKDPTWFRQTQDRGQGSAAYRKSQVEENTPLPTTKTTKLPGMMPSREPSKSPGPEITTATRDVDRFRRGTTPDIVALRNSMTEKPAHLRTSVSDLTSNATSAPDASAGGEMPPPLARASSSISQNRSPSPTKGLGGFVESAMMKRSDSVSKRWSVKGNAGLARGDSVAGPRPLSLHGRGISRDMSASRAGSPSSPLASTRPLSSHGRDLGAITATGDTSKVLEQARPDAAALPKSEDTSGQLDRPQTPSQDASLARSPSKTMDSRRWSPTKSTWLESALSQKQEPPKIQPLKEEQPQWKVDLQRKRSMRASRDVSPDKTNIESSATSNTPVTRPADPARPENPGAVFPGWSSSRSSSQTPTPQRNNPVPDRNDERDRKEEAGDKSESQTPQRESLKSFTSIDQGPPPVKPKPQTPPRTDFRASLKSRAQPQDRNTSEEPEFKSMFGKLKRTTTQNYVAPDELKNNITSGKAALNVTGGPVKTKRVDEFKESILAKKEEMRNAPTRAAARPESKPKPEDIVPEALARRKTLSKASAPNLAALPTKSQGLGLHDRDISNPDADLGSDRQIASVDILSSAQSAKARAGPISTQTERPSSLLPDRNQTRPSGLNSTGGVPSKASSTNISSQGVNNALRSSSPRLIGTTETSPTTKITSPSESSEASQPRASAGIQQNPTPVAIKTNNPSAGKLAARLNPNLAAMLSRGPATKTNNDRKEATSTTSDGTSGKQDTAEATDQESLIHMTKARAKGPKRRAPKSDKPSATLTPTPTATTGTTSGASRTDTIDSPREQPQATSLSNKLDSVSAPPGVKQSSLDTKPLTPSGIVKINETLQASSPSPASMTPKTKPEVVGKSPQLRKISGSNVPRSGASPTSIPTKPVQVVQGSSPQVMAPRALHIGQKSGSAPVQKHMPETPSRPTVEKLPAGAQKTKGLGLDISPSPRSAKPESQPRVLTPPPDAISDPPASADRSKIRTVLESYVGVIPQDCDRVDFDAQQFLLSSKPSAEKIKTMKCFIQEVTGDGKKSAMPPQQDHILYEESMYLVIHNFTLENGQSQSEVSLWCGDRVSNAAIEDAQVFCRRDAREHNTKLLIIKQGREPGNMIQALGGILIIRRNRTSQNFMLCGRKYLGHIVFDEVDVAGAALCPGFGYLISTPASKYYLWKGKGASAEEIGSARLIAMDLGLTGEIVEIEQGKEPADFWTVLHGKAQVAWSGDWKQRSSMHGLPATLYRIDHERAGMLTNLASWGLKRATSPAKQPTKMKCEPVRPFVQSDLDAAAIHVVDAYTAMYVVVTPHCAAKAAELISALYVAQDLSMLSPAVQDRPVVPTCHVVAGILPSDVKACFRKWSELEAASLMGQDSICVRLEEVMEALEL